MFGAGRPDLMVKGLPRREWRKLQAYYRYVSGWKADQNVTVEKTGVDIESDAVIVDG